MKKAVSKIIITHHTHWINLSHVDACREAFYDRTFHGSFDAAHGNYDARTFGGLKIVFQSRAAKGGWKLINETSVRPIMEAGKRDLPLRGSRIIFIKGQFMLLPSLRSTILSVCSSKPYFY